MDETVTIRIPKIWGEKTFEQDIWGNLNFLIGPNGTGKTLFAERLESSLHSHSVRYLSADRLSGMVEPSNDRRFTNSRLDSGFNLQHESAYRNQAEQQGYSSDAYILLRDKPDLRIRIQAILSEYFDRDIELKVEGGYLVPEMTDESSSTSYDLRDDESHGLKELISLLTIIHDDESDVLIIDEPELHLHPQYQKYLLREIQRLSGPPENDMSKTFFLITHSPTMVEFKSIEDMLNVYSFRSKSQPPFTVDEFSDQDRHYIENLIPRLNTQHKEALFSEEPLLVEGYSDEQIFSLAIEKHDDIVKSPETEIISVDGKENINSFFRFCQGLGLHPRVIADLDVMFNGGLRQTLSNLDPVSEMLQSAGAGSDLMDAIGPVESELEDIITELESRQLTHNSNNTLSEIQNQVNDIGESYMRRYILYRAILSYEQLFRSEFSADRIRTILGKMDTILTILSDRGYYILRKGELEDYLTDENLPLAGANKNRKSNIFQEARNRLMSSDSSADVLETVDGLVDVLLNVLDAREVSLLSHMETTVSQWIHEVQGAVQAGEVTSLSDLRSHHSVGQERYDRLFKVEEMTINGSEFECTISINESIDSNETRLRFQDDTVPSKITLES